jgi:hypothetical protein
MFWVTKTLLGYGIRPISLDAVELTEDLRGRGLFRKGVIKNNCPVQLTIYKLKKPISVEVGHYRI